MQNAKLLIGVILGTVGLVLGVALLFSQESKPQVYDQALIVGEARNVKVGNVSENVATDSAEVAEVPVTIVEFSDLQCPACRGAQSTISQVMAAFGDKVRLVYRHYPLYQIHKNAGVAAVASEAAAEMGAFWKFHDILFEKQDDWAELSDPTEKFIEYATSIGLDGVKFKELLSNKDLEDRVQADVAAGNGLGVNATPTFFVNGEKANTGELYAIVTRLLNK